MFSYRETPLSVKTTRGRLLVPKSVIDESTRLLSGFHGPDGLHEGMVYWIGRRIDDDCVVLSVIRPDCEHGPQSVFSTSQETGVVMTKAHRYHLGIVAQVHSHPGQSSIHSDGDDKLVLQAYDGMFSIVVGEYGSRGISISTGTSVHQFVDGTWHLVSTKSPDVLVTVPTYIGSCDE